MMENLPDNNSGQGGRTSPAQATSLGSMLREGRERLGLSVSDVAGQIKFAPRQIEALEAEDFRSLPEAAFLRGFVRSYAKILRLDADTLLASMPHTKATVAELIPASVGVPFPNTQSVKQQNVIWLGAASLLAVIVAAFAIWHFKTPIKQAKEPLKVTQVETPIILPTETKITSEPLVLKPTAAKEAPKVQAAEPVIPPGALPQITELRLVFGEESWTEIKDKDGKIISSQVNPAGSELRDEGNPPFAMLIGHAASASLYYQGKQVNLKPYINQYSEVAHLKLK